MRLTVSNCHPANINEIYKKGSPATKASKCDWFINEEKIYSKSKLEAALLTTHFLSKMNYVSLVLKGKSKLYTHDEN